MPTVVAPNRWGLHKAGMEVGIFYCMPSDPKPFSPPVSKAIRRRADLLTRVGEVLGPILTRMSWDPHHRQPPEAIAIRDKFNDKSAELISLVSSYAADVTDLDCSEHIDAITFWLRQLGEMYSGTSGPMLLRALCIGQNRTRIISAILSIPIDADKADSVSL